MWWRDVIDGSWGPTPHLTLASLFVPTYPASAATFRPMPPNMLDATYDAPTGEKLLTYLFNFLSIYPRINMVRVSIHSCD